MDSPVGALRASVERLHTIASGLNDSQVASPSYCDEWSIAQVLSHLGSGAVILQRSLADVRAGTTTPEDFNPSVWDEWNAKSPRSQVDDALVADEAVTEAPASAPQGEKLKAELDDLLDEIDEVLETNAEDFVKSYVQKGGE